MCSPSTGEKAEVKGGEKTGGDHGTSEREQDEAGQSSTLCLLTDG